MVVEECLSVGELEVRAVGAALGDQRPTVEANELLFDKALPPLLRTAEIGAEREEAEDEELAEPLKRVPDLSKALAEASPEVQRQTFEAFDLQITYDKVGGEDRDLGHRV